MITVLGDAIFDHWHHVEPGKRVDPATGTAILETVDIYAGLGGAGAVAWMIASLGAPVHLVTVASTWRVADFSVLCQGDQCGVSLFQDDGRVDTLKSRVFVTDDAGRSKYLYRVDTEDRGNVSRNTTDRIRGRLRELKPKSDLLIIADYAKGVVTSPLARSLCKDGDWAVFVDPGRRERIRRYVGADLVKMSEKPAGDYSPRQLAEKLRSDVAIITSGSAGCDWWSPSVEPNGGIVAAHPVEEIDPTGCGDQFLAALAVAEYRGLGTVAAIEFANLLAAQQATRRGIRPVTVGEVRELENAGHADCGKIVGA